MDREEIYRGLWRLRDRGLGLLVSFLAVKGIDVLRSPTQALKWCTERAEAGDPEGQYALAKLLWTGLAGTRDDHAAFQWCERASEQGYLPATVMLAGFYASGIGVVRNDAKSHVLLAAAAKAGSSDAMSLLGFLYVEGFGIQKDYTKGMELWRSAAELGHAEAQCHLGCELIESTNSDAASEGVRWLRAAADQGNFSAHFTLAHLYDTGGAGLPEDKELAKYHRAAAADLERE